MVSLDFSCSSCRRATRWPTAMCMRCLGPPPLTPYLEMGIYTLLENGHEPDDVAGRLGVPTATIIEIARPLLGDTDGGQ